VEKFSKAFGLNSRTDYVLMNLEAY